MKTLDREKMAQVTRTKFRKDFIRMQDNQKRLNKEEMSTSQNELNLAINKQREASRQFMQFKVEEEKKITESKVKQTIAAQER